jgi:hypothetical protein
VLLTSFYSQYHQYKIDFSQLKTQSLENLNTKPRPLTIATSIFVGTYNPY